MPCTILSVGRALCALGLACLAWYARCDHRQCDRLPVLQSHRASGTVAAYLQQKQMLLVFDNFEHLLEGLAQEILAAGGSCLRVVFPSGFISPSENLQGSSANLLIEPGR